MKTAITKLTYSSWYIPQDVFEAIKVGTYTRQFIWNDGQTDRIEHFSEQHGLFKVSYYHHPQGQEHAVAEHFRLHPNSLCEVIHTRTPPAPYARCELVDLYDEIGDYEKRTELYYDQQGRVVMRVEMDRVGLVQQVRQDKYDESGTLLTISTYDSNGKLLAEHQPDDWS
jgi:hypothetical protein